MFEAAETAGLDPDRLSWTGCFQILKCRLPECGGATPESFEAWYRGVLREMQEERTEGRRNRINPRAIKRKMSKWKKERPEHGHLPPLKEAFAEAVVMLPYSVLGLRTWPGGQPPRRSPEGSGRATADDPAGDWADAAGLRGG
jgi:hypothetical protein